MKKSFYSCRNQGKESWKWISKQNYRIFSVGLFLVLSTVVVGTSGAKSKPDRTPVDEIVLKEFATLNSYILQHPDKRLSKGVRKSLAGNLRMSEIVYRWGKACVAADSLDFYLNQTRRLLENSKRPLPIAEDLRNRGWMLRNDILVNLPEGTACKNFGDVGASPEIKIRESNNKQFSASVSFGRPTLTSVEAGGELWTQLEVPSTQSRIGEPGWPAIPTWHTLVAVPMGAEVKLERNRAHIGNTFTMNLLPFQEQAADVNDSQDRLLFADQPFVKNEKAYTIDSFLPKVPCSIELAGQVRDLQLAQLSCSSGQYNPTTNTYRSFKGIEVTITFEGGNGKFITNQSISLFEKGSENSMVTVINHAAVAAHVDWRDLLELDCLGEELLILTHPDFIDAANELAEWKRKKGIITTVEEVGDGTIYPNGSLIDAFIEARYDQCVVRPSYILLLGDAEFVPPARLDHDTSGACGDACDDETTGSDYGYAIYPHFFFDIFPDFAVGRISVNSDEEALLVVRKIVNYESDPPYIDMFSGAPFYTTTANIAQFQCCRMRADGTPRNDQPGKAQRSFTEVSETVRDVLLDDGYESERIYTTTVDDGGNCIDELDPCTRQAAYSGDPTPNRYRSGNLLPADLRSGSGFPWSGDTDDIINAFNEGRFLILHRDHGGPSGFSHPSFRTWHFGDLDNKELLPVVYSVNCASGYFDRETDSSSETESFMEQLLFEEDGGMVGGLGDNRNSPTWANSALTRGFYDATWPGVAPEFGDDDSIRRLGDILNHGKMYLITQIGVSQTAGSVSFESALGELIIWHAFGDPTLEMWTSNPHEMLLGATFDYDLYHDGLRIKYPYAGSTITAFQLTDEGTVPVGRGVVKKDTAEIPFFYPPVPKFPIYISASFKNAVSVLVTPSSSPSQTE